MKRDGKAIKTAGLEEVDNALRSVAATARSMARGDEGLDRGDWQWTASWLTKVRATLNEQAIEIARMKDALAGRVIPYETDGANVLIAAAVEQCGYQDGKDCDFSVTPSTNVRGVINQAVAHAKEHKHEPSLLGYGVTLLGFLDEDGDVSWERP